MKIRIGNRGIPPNDYVVPKAQLQFAKQNRVREVAVIANRNLALLPNGEVNSIHRTIGANHQRLLLPAAKALKGIIGRNGRVRTNSHIRWQWTVRPPSSLRLFALTHDFSAPAGAPVGPNWR